MIQFNGNFGYGYCLEKLEGVPKGLGSMHPYPLKDSLLDRRSHKSTLSDALLMSENDDSGITKIRGVKRLYFIYDPSI